MKKRIRIITAVLMLVYITALMTGCGVKNTESAANTESIANTADTESIAEEKISQYLGYRHLSHFVMNSMPDGIMTEVSETELIYENGDTYIEVTTTGDWNSLFRVYIEGEFLYEFECNGRDAIDIAQTGLRSAYVDITMDGVKDVVIAVEPPKGTSAGPGLAYAYDVKKGKAIDLFREDGSLTDEQIETVKSFLDDEFYEQFPECKDISYMRNYGRLYVDKWGQLYYSTAVTGEEQWYTIGDMLIFLNWDKEKQGIFISGLVYMPDYVEKKD